MLWVIQFRVFIYILNSLYKFTITCTYCYLYINYVFVYTVYLMLIETLNDCLLNSLSLCIMLDHVLQLLHNMISYFQIIPHKYKR